MFVPTALPTHCKGMFSPFNQGPFQHLLLDDKESDLWKEPPPQLRSMSGNGMNLLCVGYILGFIFAATEEIESLNLDASTQLGD